MPFLVSVWDSIICPVLATKSIFQSPQLFLNQKSFSLSTQMCLIICNSPIYIILFRAVHLYLCVCVCARAHMCTCVWKHFHVTVHMWKSEDNIWNWFLLSFHFGIQIRLRFSGLCGKCFNLRTHSSGPWPYSMLVLAIDESLLK